MPSLLSVIGLFTVLSVGVVCGLEADRLPPVSVTLPIPIWHPRLALPYVSLATRLGGTEKRAETAEEALKSCRGTLTTQSAENARAAALGAATLSDTQRQLERGRAEVDLLRGRSSVARAYVPAGASACARWEDADRMALLLLGDR